MNYNYIYLTLFICIILIYIRKVGNNTTENFGELNLPTFNNFIKHTRGYQCQEKTDAMPKWASEKYGKKTFCHRYPSALDLAKVSKVLVPKAVEIKKSPHVQMNANELNVRRVPTDKVKLVKSNHRIRSAPIIENKDLLKSEAIELFKREPKYSYIAVGKNKKMGETIFYAGDVKQIKGKEVSDSSYDLYEKVSSVEYSMTTWIKIDKTVGGWRNIIHHGSAQATRAPGLWIYPNDCKLGLAVLTNNRRSWGEWMSGGSKTDIPLGKWAHISVTVSTKKARCYINGKMVIDRNMGGNAIFPSNQQFYVGRGAAGGFHLSKTTWYPFELSEAFVSNLIYSTKPVPGFGVKELSALDSKPSASMTGSWKTPRGNPITVREKSGMVFIDGEIYNTTDSLNQTCFILSDKFTPDRMVKLLVSGTSSSWRNKTRVVGADTYLLTIKPNGEVSITDKKKSGVFGEYAKGLRILLSSVRFMLSKGVPIKLGWGTRQLRETSHPGITKIGSFLAFSGGVANTKYGRYLARLPGHQRPKEQTLTTGTSDKGVSTRIDFYTWGMVRFLPQNNGRANNAYLDGILLNTFKGEKIPLYNGFRNYHPWWTEARVMMDNGIVKFSGLIGMPGQRGPPNWSVKDKGCFRDGGRRDLPKYHGYTNDKRSCAKKAFTHGHRMFGLQWYGQCFSGNSYGKYGKANNCNTKCRYGNRRDNCGGGWANKVYEIGDTWYHMGRVPKNYAPKKDMRFRVDGNWRTGFIELVIRHNGHMYMMSKQVGGWGRWNHLHLNRICYLKE
tara:strand:- start:1587 stop:3932 length:2346 start_codon:yes stop_codon:yes gene_type:complete